MLTTPKGARNPLGPILLRLKTTPLLICLSRLWFQSNRSLRSKFHHTRIRNGARIDDMLAGLRPSGSLRQARWELYRTWSKMWFKGNWLQKFFIFCSQICKEGVGGETCRQVINIADQSKCKAGRRSRRCHPGHRGKTTYVVKASKQGGSLWDTWSSLREGGWGWGFWQTGRGGCFNRESQEGGSVPHPGLDAASSGKVSSPGPGSPSPAQPQIDSAQTPGWPEPGQWGGRNGKN